MGDVRRVLGVILILGVLLLCYLGVGLFVVLRMTAPSREPPEATPADAGLAYEEVELESTDGVRLVAWWVPAAEESSGAAVLVHGWGGDRSNEHILETAPIYGRAGYDVLLLDLRAQGGSEGNRRTLGYREARDVRGALAWLQDRGHEPENIVLHGWSMGGATVLRVAPGAGVAAVVEEAGYADLPLLLEGKIPEITGLPRPFVPAVLLAGWLFPDFDPWAVRPDKDAAKLAEEGVPFFIIHSTEDRVIPYAHAKMLARAYPDAEVWTLHDYEHVQAYAHPDYEEKLTNFLRASAEDG